MQFIVESSWSFAIFVGIALVMMLVATYLIFASRRAQDLRDPSGGAFTRWSIKSGRMLPTIIAFGMMFVGMALVGAWYYVETPIIDDYTFNIMAVTLVAAIIAVVASYGIALVGLYAQSIRGRKLKVG